MCHGKDDGVVAIAGGVFGEDIDAVFVFYFFGICPGVVDVNINAKGLEFVVDVDGAGVADIGTVFLEGDAEHQGFGSPDGFAGFEHELDHFASHISSHAIVESATGQDDLGVVAHLLCFLREIIRIHAYTMAANQSGAEGKEVPFGARSFEHLEGVDAHAVEDFAELVHKGDVDVALRIFDHLGGFGHLDAGG